MARSTAPDRTPNAVVAAGRRVDTTKRKQLPTFETWQAEAWDYFDAVPEVKYSTLYLGNQMSKLVLFPGVRDPKNPEADPVPVTDPGAGVDASLAAAAQAELDRLKSTDGGMAELLRELNINLEVAAELYLIGYAERIVETTDPMTKVVTTETIPERWEIRSISELTEKDGTYYVKGRPGEGRGVALTDEDTVIRIWQKHARWSDLADNAMRGVLFDCQILQSLSQQVLAEANSRQNAGLLLVPSELSFGGNDQSDTDDQAGNDQDPFTEELGDALADPIGDPSSPSAVQPLVIRGPSEYLGPDVFRLLDLARSADATLDEKIDKRVDRIARGLNLPVEVVLGHQSTTFANARQVDQDEFDDHLEPRCVLIVDALTTAYLRPNLIDAGFAPEAVAQIEVWFDPVRLIRSPDTEANADKALSNRLISAKAGRRVLGFSEDDAPDENDPLVLAEAAGTLATLAQKLYLGVGVLYTAEDARKILEQAGATFTDPPPPPAPASPAPAVAASGMTVREMFDAYQMLAASLRAAGIEPPVAEADLPKVSAAGAANPGAELLAIDREMRTRLLTAANQSMQRTLERAGNRLRSVVSPELRRTISTTPAVLRAQLLGPTIVASAANVDDLLAGAFDDLETQFRQWADIAGDDALDVASQISSGFSTTERQAMKLRLLESTDEAWSWMKEALTSLAAAKLYDPTPDAGFGEFDPTSVVPTGLIRQAMARAGGQTAFTTTGTDAWVAVKPDGSPAGGIGTGKVIKDGLSGKGVGQEGYVWRYGAGFRRTNFEPHVHLDGVEFVNFDDPVLAVTGAFPARDFYMPGDHAGCLCDFEPIIIPPKPDAGQGNAGGLAPPRPTPRPSGGTQLPTETQIEQTVQEAVDAAVTQAQAEERTLANVLEPNLPSPTSRVGKGVRTAVGQIDELHKIPDSIKGVPVRSTTGKRTLGYYEMKRDGSPVAIGISSSNSVAQVGGAEVKHQAFSFAHEFGHYLDHQGLGTPGQFTSTKWAGTPPRVNYTAWDGAEVVATRQIPADAPEEWRAFWTAVDDSGFYERAAGSGLSPGHKAYLRDPCEVWARAYSQWVSERSGDDALLAGLRGFTDKDGVTQWPAGTFDDIAAAIEGILRAEGLLP